VRLGLTFEVSEVKLLEIVYLNKTFLVTNHLIQLLFQIVEDSIVHDVTIYFFEHFCLAIFLFHD